MNLDHRGPPPNLLAEQDELHAMVRRAQLEPMYAAMQRAAEDTAAIFENRATTRQIRAAITKAAT